MTTSASPILCAPDAEWTELRMEGRGMLALCPTAEGAPIRPGEALLVDEHDDEGFTRATLADVLDDWIDTSPSDAIFAFVHPRDFAQIAPRLH